MSPENKGLARAKEIGQERTLRVKELRAEGKRIIGYPCIYVPVEILTAVGSVPFRILGDMREPVIAADRALPTSFCPLMRSCLDVALKGKDEFLDGVVMAHSCDPQEKTARVWESYVSYPYFYFIDVPGTTHKEELLYYRGELDNFKTTLEAFTGQEISADKLNEAIRSHNQQRALVRELYELRKPALPLISGVETVQVIKALASLPVDEGNELLTQVIAEVKERKGSPEEKPVRLLLYGATIDSVAMMEILESHADVVMDEHCLGIRAYQRDVKLTDDPLDGLAYHYLAEITAARTYREAVYGEASKDYKADLESRFGYLKKLINEWNVTGVIILLARYCDPFAFEVPSLKDYLDNINVPSIYIEHDYTEGILAPLATRVEAFGEMLS